MRQKVNQVFECFKMSYHWKVPSGLMKTIENPKSPKGLMDLVKQYANVEDRRTYREQKEEVHKDTPREEH